jgi:uncharacterized protein (UPF0297 family)
MEDTHYLSKHQGEKKQKVSETYCHVRKVLESKGQNPRPLTCVFFICINI